MMRRFFHYFCIALLLVAQQGALTHAAWHASGGAAHAHDALGAHGAHGHEGHAHDHEGDSESPSGQATLCEFHLAFGQVLGGMHGACVPLAIADLPVVVSVYVFNPRLGSEAVPALSRGPPVLL